MPRGKDWTRDELLAACNLYFTLPFGQMHSKNPIIIKMAGALGRTPGSVAMKLVNFASLDPAHQARGVSGLKGTSRADREIWEEFRSRWDSAVEESEMLLERLIPAEEPPTKARPVQYELPRKPHSGPTEREATLRVRAGQTFFRKAVLAAYGARCCVTGNPIPELLTASHILPWAKFPDHRTNPQNGLCLAAHFDRAFDNGLITVDERHRLKLSPQLRCWLPDAALEREFLPMELSPLRMPERFPPDESFLEFHRTNIFQER
ncbi:MAG TPA: HNH endonuclease [Terriglobia bacterium]|nr:HNH endonuclease [Terriglobia bacterium]